jgi:ligand-binding SRPBCC domain-containing protein
MRLGDQVTWEARQLGKMRRLTTRITAFDRPHRFVDEMVTGSFKSFRHDHVFEPSGDSTAYPGTREWRPAADSDVGWA